MLLKIYPDGTPRPNLSALLEALRAGDIVICPTTTGYAYCADALQARTVERICKLKGIDPKRKALSLIFNTLSEVSKYCKMSDTTFKFIREHSGNYTYILPSASSLPKLYKTRKEVGMRLAQHPLLHLLIEDLGHPLLVSSLPVEKEEIEYSTDPTLAEERYGHAVHYVVDSGLVDYAPSTVIDCTVEPFEIVRLGSGRIDREEYID